MVTFKTYISLANLLMYTLSRVQSAKGFIVELIPVILYIEMLADVLEPKAPRTPANFL